MFNVICTNYDVLEHETKKDKHFCHAMGCKITECPKVCYQYVAIGDGTVKSWHSNSAPFSYESYSVRSPELSEILSELEKLKKRIEVLEKKE